jgi:hypothetical protein
MTFKKPRAPRGTIIESASDPSGENSGHDINSGSLWLDVSSSPAVLYERNSTNTEWNALGGSGSSEITNEIKGHSFGMNIIFGS